MTCQFPQIWEAILFLHLLIIQFTGRLSTVVENLSKASNVPLGLLFLCMSFWNPPWEHSFLTFNTRTNASFIALAKEHIVSSLPREFIHVIVQYDGSQPS